LSMRPSANIWANHLPVFRLGMDVGPDVRSFRPAVRLRLMPFATNDSTEPETIFVSSRIALGQFQFSMNSTIFPAHRAWVAKAFFIPPLGETFRQEVDSQKKHDIEHTDFHFFGR